MRSGATTRRLARAGMVCLLGLLTAGAASGARQAAPLEVPTGPAPLPESRPGLTPDARIEEAARAFQAHGYRELPVLAWSLLAASRAGGDDSLAERALELAPGSPAVAFEAGWQLKRPLPLLRGLALLPASFPGLAWLLSWGGAGLGIAALVGCAIVAAACFVRTVGLHGHALGHLVAPRDPPVWPGVLLLVAAASTLPLLGVGPGLILAGVGLLATVRLPAREAGWLFALLLLAGLVVGPGLDYWARLAALPAGERPLLPAWRLEHGQPLPGDREAVAAALSRGPDDPLLRLALATSWKRQGRLDRVSALVGGFPESSPRPLAARAANLEGIVQLARAEVQESIQTFDRARALEESAAVLFNLSQAHGRALHLGDQTSLFGAARSLDPDLVSRYTGYEGANVHTYLIETPVPALVYLRNGLLPSPEATQLARGIRQAVLGPRLPATTWLVLPAAGLLGLLLRLRGLNSCARCLRVVCARCVPEEVQGGTCVRCARLFMPAEETDARVRSRQVARDRARQRWLRRGLSLLGAVLPGTGRLLEGRVATGTLSALLPALGVGAWLAAGQVAVPPDVGELGIAFPLALATLAVLPAYAWAWLAALRQATAKGARR